MTIHVEMTAEEFQEFMQWKADKGLYGSRLEASASKYKYINSKIIWALEPDGKKPGKVKIVNQEHAAELVDMARDYLHRRLEKK